MANIFMLEDARLFYFTYFVIRLTYELSVVNDSYSNSLPIRWNVSEALKSSAINSEIG